MTDLPEWLADKRYLQAASIKNVLPAIRLYDNGDGTWAMFVFQKFEGHFDPADAFPRINQLNKEWIEDYVGRLDREAEAANRDPLANLFDNL